jgi:chloramphenicol-sensitive protein RarD
VGVFIAPGRDDEVCCACISGPQTARVPDGGEGCNIPTDSTGIAVAKPGIIHVSPGHYFGRYTLFRFVRHAWYACGTVITVSKRRAGGETPAVFPFRSSQQTGTCISMNTSKPCPGLLMGFSAYAIWGIFPFYFYFLSAVSSWEVLAHRILWSVLTLLVLLWWRGRLGTIFSTLSSPRQAALLALAAVLISTNWLVYIYAIATHRTMDTSMGYFINPMFLILTGIVVFRERLNAYQTASIALAAAGIVYQLLTLGGFSWISLALPAAFSGYGAIKKHLQLESVASLFLETLIVAPFMMLYLGWQWQATGLALFDASPLVRGLLVCAGLVTTIPLLLFAEGAKRLPLYMMGFLQYVTPSLLFVIGHFAFGEPLDHHKLVGFVLVWIGLAVLIAGQAQSLRRRRALVPAAEME